MVKELKVERSIYLTLEPTTDKSGKEDPASNVFLLRKLQEEGLVGGLIPDTQEIADFLNTPNNRGLGSVYDIKAITGVFRQILNVLSQDYGEAEENLVTYFQEKGLDPGVLQERIRRMRKNNQEINSTNLLSLVIVDENNQLKLTNLGQRLKEGKATLSTGKKLGIICQVVDELFSPGIS